MFDLHNTTSLTCSLVFSISDLNNRIIPNRFYCLDFQLAACGFASLPKITPVRLRELAFHMLGVNLTAVFISCMRYELCIIYVDFVLSDEVV